LIGVGTDDGLVMSNAHVTFGAETSGVAVAVAVAVAVGVFPPPAIAGSGPATVRTRSNIPAPLSAIHLGVESQRPMGTPLRSEPRRQDCRRYRRVKHPDGAGYDGAGTLATEKAT
jgi:hypothetical protein